MPIHRYIEVACDQCGQAEHYLVGQDWKALYRKDYGIVTRLGRVFCRTDCYEEYKYQEKCAKGVENETSETVDLQVARH